MRLPPRKRRLLLFLGCMIRVYCTDGWNVPPRGLYLVTGTFCLFTLTSGAIDMRLVCPESALAPGQFDDFTGFLDRIGW